MAIKPSKHDCVQGDSFAFDFTAKELEEFDPNWGGSWAIKESIDKSAVPLASGTLSVSGDNKKLELRITPTDTETIPVGKYFLIVEVTNDSAEFKQEIMQDQFEIMVQGI